jgi:hypothetical protein
VAQHDPAASTRDDLSVRQYPSRIGGVVVSMNGYDRCKLTQAIQHPQRAHITSMQNQVDTAQDIADGRREIEAFLGHVGIGDQTKTGNHMLRCQLTGQECFSFTQGCSRALYNPL